MKTATLSLVFAPLLTAAISAPTAQPRAAAPANSTIDAPTALDAVSELRQIDKTSFSARDSLIDQVNQRIAAGEQVMAAMENRARSFDAPSRAQFNTYLDAAKKQEAALKRSLDDVHKATPDTWEHTQVMLGITYELYDDVMEVLNVMAPPLPQ